MSIHPSQEPRAPRDLAEFVLRWHEFRTIAERTLVDMRDDRQKAMVLGWLIRLADYVGPKDLEDQETRSHRHG